MKGTRHLIRPHAVSCFQNEVLGTIEAVFQGVNVTLCRSSFDYQRTKAFYSFLLMEINGNTLQKAV